MATNEKPSWIINSKGELASNAALKQVFENELEVKRQLKQAQVSKAGALLAYQFVVNPNLHEFKITVEKVARSFCELNLVEATNVHGREVLFPSIDLLESDELQDLFDAFKPNPQGVVEIHCTRNAIASLLLGTTELNGSEAFHKLFPNEHKLQRRTLE